ncbi:hypothetical protein O9993_21535 [Vibrio lentus]|nr:hypothetical protein [Vibrio lentus]
MFVTDRDAAGFMNRKTLPRRQVDWPLWRHADINDSGYRIGTI